MKKISSILAFTLAEILVTLAIVSVVSALAIPGLKNHTNEKKYVTLAQKAYSDISNATANLELNHSNIRFWNWNAKTSDGASLVGSWYKQIMNVANGSKVSNKASIPYSTVNGQSSSAGSAMTTNIAFVSTDGMCWQIGADAYSTSGPYAIVDVNCSQPPNIIGIDAHMFYITNDGVLPAGTANSNKDKYKDWKCTAYVIKYGEMPWLNKYNKIGCPSI